MDVLSSIMNGSTRPPKDIIGAELAVLSGVLYGNGIEGLRSGGEPDIKMTNQVNPTNHYENPPVIETALSVQFDPIQGLTPAHFGWYWKSFLDSNWSKTTEAPP